MENSTINNTVSYVRSVSKKFVDRAYAKERIIRNIIMEMDGEYVRDEDGNLTYDEDYNPVKTIEDSEYNKMLERLLDLVIQME